MTTKKAGLSIDCVAMKRSIQAKIAAEIKGMSHEEELAYYRRSVLFGPMAAFWRSLTSKVPEKPGPAKSRTGKSARSVRTERRRPR